MQALSVIPPGSDRSQWLGGADIAAVLGISPWTTPLQLWEAKTHPGAVEAAATGVRRRGVRWEGAVAEMLVEDLARLFPREGDTPALVADEELTAKVLRLRAVLAEVRARELEAQALEFEVKRAMGEHGALLQPGGARAVDWKARSGACIDEAALKKAHPAIGRAFTRRWEARVLSVRSFDVKDCER